ncbi:hypothetical protein Aau02nite_74050 [Amorphoplanes auranticolor]|uniref:Uncharacterized protein n=2 Tax=Actinoplanes auranticolor TaxID=47988 RepID=A0A919ST41_9ACTN|nr:hypothetical protein Aau02nite_74050 [Actinoplanes auranticolor]
MRRVALFATGVILIALSAIFIAAGLEKADQVASTVGALAGVAGCGFSVWAWLSESARSPSTRTPSSDTAPTAVRPQVDAARAQGIQIGDGNTQHNRFE